jgi:hypothetical protein
MFTFHLLNRCGDLTLHTRGNSIPVDNVSGQASPSF